MSIINRMLKDLETHPLKGDAAPIYRPAPRRLPGWYWWLLLLLPLSLWLWWQPLQQRLHPAVTPAAVTQTTAPSRPVVTVPVSTQTGPAAAVATAGSAPVAVAEPAKIAAEARSFQHPENAQITPRPPVTDDRSRAITNTAPETAPVDEKQEVAAEEPAQTAAIYEAEPMTEPEPLGEMLVEEQQLSAGEIAALERRKYQQALARRDHVAARQALLQVLANDPLDHNSRKQLAALYYGENQLSAAREVLQQGITLAPSNADLRLLAARVAQAMGEKQAALQLLQAISPSALNNLDFYALRAALAQQLGQTTEAGDSYQALARAQPMIGRWWLGLAISQEQRGLMTDARQAYRRALLDNQLSAASRRFAQQRIQQLEP